MKHLEKETPSSMEEPLEIMKSSPTTPTPIWTGA
jgi:hypothetical protein